MPPPKQLFVVIAARTNIQHVKSDLENMPTILANVGKGVEYDDYNQDYKSIYDFDDDDACCINHSHKNVPDEEDNEFDVNENEYTNGALSRSVKVVYGKRNDCDGYNGCNDDEEFDAEDVDCTENEPSPFFQEDDEIDKFDDQSYEDGDWADENETDYYIDDDCW